MGVYAAGNSYGIPEDLIYSFPIQIKVRDALKMKHEKRFWGHFHLIDEIKHLQAESLFFRLINKINPDGSVKSKAPNKEQSVFLFFPRVSAHDLTELYLLQKTIISLFCLFSFLISKITHQYLLYYFSNKSSCINIHLWYIFCYCSLLYDKTATLCVTSQNATKLRQIFLLLQNKTWKVVDGLPINDFSRAKMDATAAELVEERDTAMDFLSQWLSPPAGQQKLPDPLQAPCSRLWSQSPPLF